jgi:hypothetical protein
MLFIGKGIGKNDGLTFPDMFLGNPILQKPGGPLGEMFGTKRTQSFKRFVEQSGEIRVSQIFKPVGD